MAAVGSALRTDAAPDAALSSAWTYLLHTETDRAADPRPAAIAVHIIYETRAHLHEPSVLHYTTLLSLHEPSVLHPVLYGAKWSQQEFI